MNNKIPFNYSSADIENYPLERLLSIFAKLSKNEKLYSRLNKLRDVRNHVAHQSLVAIIGSDEIKINDKLNNFLEHNNEVIACLGLLILEIKALGNLR